jgi:hypothetical protein
MESICTYKQCKVYSYRRENETLIKSLCCDKVHRFIRDYNFWVSPSFDWINRALGPFLQQELAAGAF